MYIHTQTCDPVAVLIVTGHFPANLDICPVNYSLCLILAATYVHMYVHTYVRMSKHFSSHTNL